MPGSSGIVTLRFQTPVFNSFCFLRLRVIKDGQERFADRLTFYEIVGGEDFRPDFNSPDRRFL